MTGTMIRRDRYPGARPFADDPIDQQLFFGRAPETEQLFHRIAAESLLVVYGKSGLGKTSLLQAGVFPRLRERELLPVPVRLNRPDLVPLAVVGEALQRACREQGIDYEPGEAGDLWTLFKSAVLWRGDALQTPVLVLDQFEELFTLHDAEDRRRYAGALGDLLGGRLPEAVRERIRAGERLPFGEGPPAVKAVLALREDHLGNLEELAAELPPVLENRFRLTALDQKAARAAIVEPAGLVQGEDLASPPLRFTETALSDLLGFLEGRSGIIEPFQLQVLCRHLERQAVRKAQAVPAGELTIDRRDLGGPRGMTSVLGNFYRDALDALPERRQRRRARNLCEWGLLSEEGRRLPMERDQIRRQFRVEADSLRRLVDARLLRSEPRLEGVFYEFSHDTLAEPVLKHRRWRLPRGAKYALLALLVLLAGAVTVLVLTERERRRAEHHAQRAELARAEAEGLIEFMLFDLRDKLMPFGRLDLLRDVQDRIDAYYEHLGIDADDLSMQRRRMSALNNKGDTLLARGELTAAAEIYHEAYEIAERLAGADPSNAGWQRDLSVSLNKVGDIKAAQGDLAGALKAYEESKAIRERLAGADPSNAGWQRDLSVSLDNVGGIKAAQGDLAGALKAYEESKAIRERLAGADPSNAGWQRDLSVSLDNVGDIKTAQGDLAGALKAYEEGKAIRERLAGADPSNAGWQRDLYVSHWRLAAMAEQRGQPEEALGHWRQAYEVLQGFAERGLHVTPEDLAFLEELRLKLQLAEDPGSVAREIEALLEADPDDAELYNTVQALYHEQLFDYAAAHRVTAAWVARHPEDLGTRCNLAETLLTTGRTVEARDTLADLIAGDSETGKDASTLDAGTEAALRLLEIAALTRLAADAGDTGDGPGAALVARRAELEALLTAQPEGFTIGWTFRGTLKYLGTDPDYADYRDTLMPLFEAAGQGRETLLGRLRQP